MQRKVKRILSLVLCLLLVFSMMSVGALATTYTAPTSGVVANEKILAGATSKAATPTLSMFGINIVASSTQGVYNANGTSSEWGTDSANLGTFGSDVNDNPDPYLYNFFYNYNSTHTGGGTYSLEDYSAWNASPYTLIGDASTTTTISIGGVTKTCSPYFFYEPEIIGAGNSNYLAAYQETYNADYNPISFVTSNAHNARTDGLGNIYNMFENSASMVEGGKAIDELSEETGKLTRYADSAGEIGSNYDKWSRGFYYWAQLMFDVYDDCLTDEEAAELESYGVDIDALGGGLEKVRGVRSFSYDSDTDSWTILNTTSTMTQHASGIVEDVYDVLMEEIAAGTRDSYVLTTDELVEYLAPEGRKAGVIIGVGQGVNVESLVPTEAAEKLSNAGIRILTNLPVTVYGLTMAACDNALGQPYYLGYIYYDQLAAMTGVDMTLNPISLVFYWMKNFYHVSDNDAMQTAIVNMLEDADLPEGMVVNDSATTDNFGSGVEESIENMIILGMKYYLAVEEPRLDAAGVYADENSDDPSIAYWYTLTADVLSMGIGSDDIYLNPEGNGVANRHLNAQNYASDGTVDTFYTEYSSYIQEGTIVSGMTYGDINGDGSIDLSDVLIVLRSVAKALTLTDTQATYADVTNDGSVGVADAVLLLQYIAADGEGVTLGPSTSGGGSQR